MAVTLKDVAQAAGVSLATASRAFKEAELLAPKTRQRVMEAAVRVGYDVPPSSRSKTLALIVPDVANAVFAAWIKAVQDKAWPARHRVLVGDTNEDPARELELVESLGHAADGLIVCSPRSEGGRIKKAAAQTPLVVVNGHVSGAPCVLMDVRQGITQAVEHLQALGHRRLAYVPGPAASWANRARLGALSELTAERGLELTTASNQSANVHGGLAAAAAVVASGATAVVAYNDLVALGIQAGVRSMGYTCPGDLSIVGIDDLDVAAVSDPGLTSIRVAIDRSGALALEYVLDLLHGKSVDLRPLLLDSQLIVRGSTTAQGTQAVRSARDVLAAP